MGFNKKDSRSAQPNIAASGKRGHGELGCYQQSWAYAFVVADGPRPAYCAVPKLRELLAPQSCWPLPILWYPSGGEVVEGSKVHPYKAFVQCVKNIIFRPE